MTVMTNKKREGRKIITGEVYQVESFGLCFSAHDVSERETDAFLAEFAGKWPFEGIEPEEVTKICEGNRSDNRPIAAFNE